MQNRRINVNIAQPNLPGHRVYGVGSNAARCFSGCSLIPRIINTELTMLTAWLTPFLSLTTNKNYVSQDSIDFTDVLSLFRLHAFRCRLFLLHCVSPGAYYPYRFLFTQVRFPDETPCALWLRTWFYPFSIGRHIDGDWSKSYDDWMVVDTFF